MSEDEDRSVFDLIGREPDSVLRYGNNVDQNIDIYQGVSTDRPLLILIHGGYWSPQYDRHHIRPLAQELAKNGWKVASLEYRRIPGNPDATTSDVKAGISYAIENIAGYNGEIILIGHSAGGHLALWAISVLEEVRVGVGVKAVIALAPVTDLLRGEEMYLDDGAITRFIGVPASERADLDPILLSTFDIPVTLIHGEKDIRVPIELSEAYLLAKKVENGKVTLIKLVGTGHFELIDPRSAAWKITEKELEKLKN